jgi:GNAT superfamily N-acetyltransferase
LTADTVVTIREVEPRDEAAIARLWQELSDYHVVLDPRLPAPVPGAAGLYASRLLERRDDPDTRTFVAEVDGEAVGYVLGAVIDMLPDLFEHDDVGFIADIYVVEPYRRRGIARALVDTINAWFAEQGVSHTEWQVADANAPGRRFWESVGGRPLMTRMRVELNGR